jgi:hypothetical protein
VLFMLLRHGQLLGMADAPVLRVVIEAGFDRALWLFEPPAAVPPADVRRPYPGAPWRCARSCSTCCQQDRRDQADRDRRRCSTWSPRALAVFNARPPTAPRRPSAAARRWAPR